ncbi:MAG: hypothetical protein Q8R91_03380 [Candidatus Omnitrophota bacterium]|nr:hypothetical protein [Candidatus Omnitrophota bacterium]
MPAILLLIVLAKQSVDAYTSLQHLMQSPDFDAKLRMTHVQFMDRLSDALGGSVDLSALNLKTVVLDGLRDVSQFLLSISSNLVTGFAFQTFLSMYKTEFQAQLGERQP